MSKRARYDGPNPVLVDLNEGDVTKAPNFVQVEPGHLLPADVPAKIRDDLLKGDDWTEVSGPSTSSSSSPSTDTTTKKGDR